MRGSSDMAAASGRSSMVSASTVLAVMALALAVLVPGASAQGPDCGPFMPTDEIARGMQGEGLTVVQGTTPETFDVEVLGVLQGGVGVGRDMIIVEVAAPFIDEYGGIWQGMSGSPVYVDGRLIGAVAYGLAANSSAIGGLTPAEDMIDVAGLPGGDADDGGAFAAAAEEVVLTGALVADVAQRLEGDGGFAQSGVTMRRLPVPYSVSGLSAQRLDLLQDAADGTGLSVTAHGGSSADYSQVPTTSAVPEPGDNLAVAQSFGDLTSAAVGTATLVCDGQLVGFGHPFLGIGATTAGAATADAITIVPDDTFAPFKLANIGALFGTVDQDRLAGVRADSGSRPPRIPITSTVTDTDLDRSRDGRTDVVSPDLIADLAAMHLLGNIDTVIDRIGPGGSGVSFTVRGTGSDSGAFELQRDNVHVSTFDIAFESVFELLSHLATLTQFEDEVVSIDSVDIDAVFEEAVEAYDISGVRVGVDGGPPQDTATAEVLVQPGSALLVEVDLDATGGAPTITALLTVTVPEDAYGFGYLELIGGSGLFGDLCLFDPAACEIEADGQTVQDLVATLEAQPRNDEVSARVVVPTLSGGDPQPGPGPTPTAPPMPAPTATPTPAPPGQDEPVTADGGRVDGPRYAQVPDPAPDPSGDPSGDPVADAAGDRVAVDRVVRGALALSLVVDSPVCPECPPVFNRFAGEERTATAAGIATGVYGVADVVVLAPAGDYPSALVAGPLANREGGPVLLSGDDALAPASAEAIRQLGATRAIVVAPDGQLGGSTDTDLAAAGITTIERIDGPDRYAVAGAIAERLGGPRAWLVEGENPDPSRGWPDAMSAAAVAGLEGAPILLTRAADLPATTATTLEAAGITDVSIAGGEAAVGPAVVQALTDRGITVERLAGATRDETSYLLAQRAVALGALPQNTWMVTAGDFPDALAAAPAIVHTGGVMIMGDGSDLYRTPGAAAHFADLRFTAPFVTFVGGFDAISQVVEEQVFAILTGQDGPPDGPPAPDGPEGG